MDTIPHPQIPVQPEPGPIPAVLHSEFDQLYYVLCNRLRLANDLTVLHEVSQLLTQKGYG